MVNAPVRIFMSYFYCVDEMRKKPDTKQTICLEARATLNTDIRFYGVNPLFPKLEKKIKIQNLQK